jgi:hypothetical protein
VVVLDLTGATFLSSNGISTLLQAALHHRTVIEQAKGVLAESGDLDMHQAYLALRAYAHAHRRRLSDVARDIAAVALDSAVLLRDPAVTPGP